MTIQTLAIVSPLLIVIIAGAFVMLSNLSLERQKVAEAASLASNQPEAKPIPSEVQAKLDSIFEAALKSTSMGMTAGTSLLPRTLAPIERLTLPNLGGSPFVRPEDIVEAATREIAKRLEEIRKISDLARVSRGNV